MYEERQYFVYMMASKNNRALYIGVTNDLQRRVFEHQQHLKDGFTKKYNCVKLVYFEDTNDIGEAIAGEKRIKKWRREKKNKLVESMNPKWEDLSGGIFN